MNILTTLLHEMDGGSPAQTTFSEDQARQVGDALGVNWDEITLEQFKMGMNVEAEHGDVTQNDPEKIGKIAWAHLREMPDYYTKLKKMEEGEVETHGWYEKDGKKMRSPTDGATWKWKKSSNKKADSLADIHKQVFGKKKKDEGVSEMTFLHYEDDTERPEILNTIKALGYEPLLKTTQAKRVIGINADVNSTDVKVIAKAVEKFKGAFVESYVIDDMDSYVQAIFEAENMVEYWNQKKLDKYRNKTDKLADKALYARHADRANKDKYADEWKSRSTRQVQRQKAYYKLKKSGKLKQGPVGESEELDEYMSAADVHKTRKKAWEEVDSGKTTSHKAQLLKKRADAIVKLRSKGKLKTRPAD